MTASVVKTRHFVSICLVSYLYIVRMDPLYLLSFPVPILGSSPGWTEFADAKGNTASQIGPLHPLLLSGRAVLLHNIYHAWCSPSSALAVEETYPLVWR